MGRYAGKITCNIHSFDWRPERRSWLDVVLSASKAAYAQSVMKLCGDKWKATKAAGTTNGETWPQFLPQCRVPQSGGAAPAAPTYAPAPLRPFRLMVKRPEAQARPQVSVTPNTRRTKPRSERPVRPSARLSLLAAQAMRRSRREPQPRRRLLTNHRRRRPRLRRPLHRQPAPSSLGSSPPPRASAHACELRPRSYSDRRGPVRVRSTSTRPLPVRYNRLGQHEVARLPLLGRAQLQDHEGRRVHVRSGRASRRRPCGDERASSLTFNVPTLWWARRGREIEHHPDAWRPVPSASRCRGQRA
jgi:hypothetical protein